jgi:hypothetical protein
LLRGGFFSAEAASVSLSAPAALSPSPSASTGDTLLIIDTAGPALSRFADPSTTRSVTDAPAPSTTTREFGAIVARLRSENTSSAPLADVTISSPATTGSELTPPAGSDTSLSFTLPELVTRATGVAAIAATPQTNAHRNTCLIFESSLVSIGPNPVLDNNKLAQKPRISVYVCQRKARPGHNPATHASSIAFDGTYKLKSVAL